MLENHVCINASGVKRCASFRMFFSISAIIAVCIGWTSGRPKNVRASIGVQSISTVTFMAGPQKHGVAPAIASSSALSTGSGPADDSLRRPDRPGAADRAGQGPQFFAIPFLIWP